MTTPENHADERDVLLNIRVERLYSVRFTPKQWAEEVAQLDMNEETEFDSDNLSEIADWLRRDWQGDEYLSELVATDRWLDDVDIDLDHISRATR